MTPSDHKVPVITSTPPPPIALYIDRLEFTQATEIGQTILSPPPFHTFEEILVERKDVTVRVYLGVHGPTPIPPGTQFAGELTVPGLPTFFSVTGPISGDVVTTDNYQSPPGITPTGNKNLDQRSQNGQSLMFTIPGEVCIGTLQCSVAAYPLDQANNRATQSFPVPSNSQSVVTGASQPVAFLPVKPLRIQPVLIRYTGFATVTIPGGGTGKPKLIHTVDLTATLDEALQALDWVKKVYPISDLTVEPPLTTTWNPNIAAPANLWALRQQVADLRPAGDTSTIYVGFLSSQIFATTGFQFPRGIGLVVDHTALTVGLNGPAAAHAIGRALGLAIIECQTPLPPYALPFTSGLVNWGAPEWTWGGAGQNANNPNFGIVLPGVAPLPSWNVAIPPAQNVDQNVKMLSNVAAGGNMSLQASRAQSGWQADDSGFSLTIQTDATGENVINPVADPLGPQPAPTPTTTTVLGPPKYNAVAGVAMDCTQGFNCKFTVPGTKPVKLFLNLTQRPNLKSGLSIVPVNAMNAVWSTDGPPIGAGNPGGYDYLTSGFAMDATNPAVQLTLVPGDYYLRADADISIEPNGGTGTTLVNTSSAASSFTMGTGQFILAEDTPVSETVPTTNNLPAGTIADVGVDNQRFWVYDPQIYYDFMSFCGPASWVSPYTYKNLLAKISAL